MGAGAVVVAAAVLAAGAGRRLGGPKADLEIGGRRLLDRAVEVLRDAGCAPLYAVVRAGTRVRAAEPVINPDPDRGLRSSLCLAVEAAHDADALLVTLVDLPGLTADTVARVAAAWRPGRIAVAVPAGGNRSPGDGRHGVGDHVVVGHPVVGHPVVGHPVVGHPVVGHPVAGHPVVGHPVAGHPVVGHPIVMAPELWAAALDLAGPDEGARAFLRARPDLVDEVPVADDLDDLDTAADLERWRLR